MVDRLQDKVAIITGSTSGIGRETAKLFAKEGARVVVSGRREELGAKVVEEIVSAGGDAHFMQADVSVHEQIRDLIQFAVDEYGRLDILMNNAWSGKHGTVLELSEADFDAAVNVSIKATFLACKYAIPAMIESGGGSIINTASVHGILAGARTASYETIKAGLVNLTRQIAVDFGHDGIRCNSICPGWIIVEATKDRVGGISESMKRAQVIYPVGRPGYPIDCAYAALYLASDESTFVTGHALMVDGGLTIQLQDSLVFRTEEALEKNGGKW